ncbi:MAG: hypothetical protein AB8E15_04500 [Bdellovibrionales bacterium]
MAAAYSTGSSSFGSRSLFLGFSFGELMIVTPILCVLLSFASILLLNFTSYKANAVYISMLSLLVFVFGAAFLSFQYSQFQKAKKTQELLEREKVEKALISYERVFVWTEERSLGIREEFISFDPRTKTYLLVLDRYDNFEVSPIARKDGTGTIKFFGVKDEAELTEFYQNYRDSQGDTLISRYKDFNKIYIASPQ